jgi:glutathione S-transferase
MKLYDFVKSGNCYKVRLLLSILAKDYQKIPVDLKGGETSSEEFLKINPNGFVPVLVDGETTISDSAAILTYLARTYADVNWLPDDALQLSSVVRWLAFEQSEGRYGLARARIIALKTPSLLAQTGTLEESQSIAELALQTLDKHLQQNQWLAGGEQPSIADIACYPYVALSHEGGISREPYVEVRRWMQQIETLPGYIALP